MYALSLSGHNIIGSRFLGGAAVGVPSAMKYALDSGTIVIHCFACNRTEFIMDTYDPLPYNDYTLADEKYVSDYFDRHDPTYSQMKNKFSIISAPCGSGKTTMMKRFLTVIQNDHKQQGLPPPLIIVVLSRKNLCSNLSQMFNVVNYSDIPKGNKSTSTWNASTVREVEFCFRVSRLTIFT